ncbi:MAG: N-acetyltransferase family protein [Bauldia sp.]
MPSPKAPFLIRAASPADAEALAAIYRAEVLGGTATFELVPPDAAEMDRRRRELTDGGFPYLVAESGNTILGYAYAGPYRLRPAYRFTVEDSIYVATSARRQGVGHALLVALIDACAERGFRQMIAAIGDSANAASIAVHASAGFAHAGTLHQVGWKMGRWLDVVLMQRALGPGNAAPPSEAAVTR